MSARLQIGGVDIPPNSQRLVELRLPLLYTHTPVVLSTQVTRGRRDGPCLFVCAAVHRGRDQRGRDRPQVRRAPALTHLRGTLILVPVVNVYGFVRQSRYLPDRRDLNRCFPGSEKGSLAARLANAFLEEIVTKADFGIDLHTGAVHRENLPQIRASFDDSGRVEGLAKAFGSPVILNADLRDGSLREAATNLGVPVLVYEGGEALRFSELAIGAGVRGVLGVLRALGMLGGAKRSSRFRQDHPEAVIATSSQWVRAPQSGILRVPGLGDPGREGGQSRGLDRRSPGRQRDSGGIAHRRHHHRQGQPAPGERGRGPLPHRPLWRARHGRRDCQSASKTPSAPIRCHAPAGASA